MTVAAKHLQVVTLSTHAQRSRELAITRGLHPFSSAARAIGVTFHPQTCALQSAAWRVASASVAGCDYIVSYSAASGVCQCECVAAQHGQACWHAGLGLLIADELHALYPARSEAEQERAALRDLALNDNARCLGYGK